MTALRKELNREVSKLKRNWPAYFLGFILFGVLPYINYYFIDGVYYNKVLEFQNGVDPQALRTDKDEYCPGEKLRVETAFCKTRNTIDIERSMYMSNGNLLPLDVPEEVAELPIGCVPVDGGVTIATLHTIPVDTLPGFHVTVGNNQYTIEGNRKRQQDYKTIPYMVLPAEECTMN